MTGASNIAIDLAPLSPEELEECPDRAATEHDLIEPEIVSPVPENAEPISRALALPQPREPTFVRHRLLEQGRWYERNPATVMVQVS
jgi:hypothetical protein